MASTNRSTKNTFTEKTHEGAPAARMTAVQALRRSVMSCLLFENEAYEDGVEISTRIAKLAEQVPVDTLAQIAIEAREVANLRHVPLLLLVTLAKRGSGNGLVSETIARVIQRADELSELVALYWKYNPPRDGARKAPLSKQMKLGLAKAFAKFDAYQIAKYDRAKEVRLRDVLFLSHPKAANDERQSLYKGLVDQTLESPDTWEVALSAGGDKKAEFTRLLEDKKLGYLALLRNLRNMEQAGVDRKLVIDAIKARKGGAHRVLPFRYIAAARAAPTFEPALDEALIASIADMPKLPGRTVVMVDVSGSMDEKLSGKSDLTRIDAASALASVIPAEDLRVISFSNKIVEVPARKGMAGVDAIRRSQPHIGTALVQAVATVQSKFEFDRLIIITDEQASGKTVNHMLGGGSMPAPKVKHSYVINVASAKNGIGYGKWTHIDGFSESVLRFIHEAENAGVIGEALLPEGVRD
ncbi:RNA-binding protein [Caulobacter phage CcrColossus]|uniref:Putative TROVE-like domain protein n=1 Tax=Caulobacter phage CcrColossus TaxID=1211640 RepID=K4JRQ9_9CAUD|nr:RNA-binding protein [Caulobacter phage CcrColossus]AFU88009.1 putative TROVE-like domain protein [Caulobacter phage CcrColossus]